MTYSANTRLASLVSRRKWGLRLIATLALPFGAFAQGAAPENRVKAAFVFNFLKLVEWPTTAFPTSETPLVLGILGRDSIGNDLDEAVAGKLVGGRPIQFRRFGTGEDLSQCHALFIPTSEKRRFTGLSEGVRGAPVLTIGDQFEDFAKSGAIINLIRDSDKMRFEINVESAKKSGIKIHSTLLNLARIIPSPK